MKFSELIEHLGDAASQNSLPELNPEIIGIAPVDGEASGKLSFIEGEKFAKEIETTSATALMIPPGLKSIVAERGMAWIATSEPRLLFAKAIAIFYQPYHLPAGIHPTAVIDPSVELGENVAIGAHVVIEAGVKLGNEVCIHPNVVIYPQATIGDRTTLHSNCTIHERTQIGKNCVIHSGAVIGAEGFGFVPTPQGWYKMHQSGYTVLEDGVEIGCNTCVDRPAVGETRIGRNTKIDNLVQIGHGCRIGSNCAIAGQAGMAGGVKLGNSVIMAGQSGIANQSIIGDGAILAAKAGIHSNISPGEVVSGSPAIPHKKFLKISAIYNRLPEMYQTLKELKQHLNPGK